MNSQVMVFSKLLSLAFFAISVANVIIVGGDSVSHGNYTYCEQALKYDIVLTAFVTNVSVNHVVPLLLDNGSVIYANFTFIIRQYGDVLRNKNLSIEVGSIDVEQNTMHVVVYLNNAFIKLDYLVNGNVTITVKPYNVTHVLVTFRLDDVWALPPLWARSLSIANLSRIEYRFLVDVSSGAASLIYNDGMVPVGRTLFFIPELVSPFGYATAILSNVEDKMRKIVENEQLLKEIALKISSEKDPRRRTELQQALLEDLSVYHGSSFKFSYLGYRCRADWGVDGYIIGCLAPFSMYFNVIVFDHILLRELSDVLAKALANNDVETIARVLRNVFSVKTVIFPYNVTGTKNVAMITSRSFSPSSVNDFIILVLPPLSVNGSIIYSMLTKGPSTGETLDDLIESILEQQSEIIGVSKEVLREHLNVTVAGDIVVFELSYGDYNVTIVAPLWPRDLNGTDYVCLHVEAPLSLLAEKSFKAWSVDSGKVMPALAKAQVIIWEFVKTIVESGGDREAVSRVLNKIVELKRELAKQFEYSITVDDILFSLANWSKQLMIEETETVTATTIKEIGSKAENVSKPIEAANVTGIKVEVQPTSRKAEASYFRLGIHYLVAAVLVVVIVILLYLWRRGGGFEAGSTTYH